MKGTVGALALLAATLPVSGIAQLITSGPVTNGLDEVC